MKKMIPYEKLSKKQQQTLNKAKRGTWGSLNPLTRTPPNSKAYNRRRTQDWKKELPDPASFLFAQGKFCGIMDKTIHKEYSHAVDRH